MNNSCCCRNKQCCRENDAYRILYNAERRSGKVLSFKQRKAVIEILKQEIAEFENNMPEE